MLKFGRKLSNILKYKTPKIKSREKHTLPPLPFSYDALEPVICEEIMQIHHLKHHQTYVNNLNTLEEQLSDAMSKKDSAKIIELGNHIKFNGGGHINHSIFWENLTPNKTDPSCDLTDSIDKQFGCYKKFKEEMTKITVGIQGSGWGWLAYNPQRKMLQLATCSNQDPLEATTGLVPLFGIDVWEHAYYLQYKNVRQSYVEAIFELINWKDVSARLAAAKCSYIYK